MRALMLEARSRIGEAFGAALVTALAQRAIALDRVSSPLHFEAALAQDATACALLMVESATSGAVRALLQSLRDRRSALPVIVVTASGAATDRISWIDDGADDCLTLPADSDEVAARVAASMRRTARTALPRELRHGPLVLQLGPRSVSWRGETIALTPREFTLLEAFVRQAGRVLPRETLHEALHGGDNRIAGNTVEVYVHALRRKVHPRLIRTVRGAGYRLAETAALDAA
jgi:DNA-binding response OmpR family regulator